MHIKELLLRFLSGCGRLKALLVGILEIMQEKNYLSLLVVKLIKQSRIRHLVN